MSITAITDDFYRLLVVEDDPVIAQNLIDQIEQSESLIFIGHADTPLSAIALLELRPDVVILDLGLIDGSGLDVLRAAKANPEFSEIKFLVYSLFADEGHVLSAMAMGACGYMLKDTSPEEMVEKVHETLNGQTPLSSAAATHLLNRFRLLSSAPTAAPAAPQPTLPPASEINCGLTLRETETLQLLGKGLSYKLTAQALDISTHTVADYVKQIYRKLKVNSRSEAVFEALNAGIIKL